VSLLVSSLIFNLLILFLVGFLQDLLSAYYLRLVQDQRLLLATFISFIHSLVGWAIWIWFMYQFQNPETMGGLQAVAISAGGSLGTYFGLRRPYDKRNIRS